MSSSLNQILLLKLTNNFLSSLLIGLRFGCSRYHSNMAKVLFSVSAVSIALGIAVLIISLSAMNGFEYELNKRILSVLPHGEIKLINQPCTHWKVILNKIKHEPGIIAAAPYIDFTGIIRSKSNLHAVQIRGIDPQQEEKFSTLSKFVSDDAWINFKSGMHQIIIGKGIADALNIKYGDLVSIMIPNINNNSHKLNQPRYIHLYVSGILQFNGQLDYNFAAISIASAQEFLNMGDSITGIAIKVNDIFKADKLVHHASKIINQNIYISSWTNKYGHLYHDIQMIRAIIYLAVVLITLVAYFNIISTLLIVVKNRSRDIAILRTLGATDGFIYKIFIWHGLLVGFNGSLYGALIGIVVSLKLTSIANFIEKLIKSKILSTSIYFVDFLPSELHLIHVFYVLIITLLLSLVASLYPSYLAIKVDPVNILSKSGKVNN